MKKLYFIAIAALLALAIVSCDNFAAPKADKGETEDGLVTLNLGTGGTSRALNATLGRAGTTYYEASFRRGANIVRASWNWATTGRITLAPGTYDVILLAGRNSDKTLLGVGRVTAIDGGGAGFAGKAVTIASDSTTLTFTVAALTNDISMDVSGATPVPSTDMTFSVVSTVATDPVIPVRPMLDDFGNTVPIFVLNRLQTVTATWTFTIPGTAGTAAGVGTEGNLAGVSADILLLGVGTQGGRIQSTGHSSRNSNNVPVVPTTTWTGPAPDAPLPVAGFTFTILAPDLDGAAYIALEVPVYAFAAAGTPDAADPVIWYVRGGLNNGMIDAGETPSNPNQQQGQLGGAIAIGFGNIDALPDLELVVGSW